MRITQLLVVAALCLAPPGLLYAQTAGADAEFPYLILVDQGATEFDTGDTIVITTLRGKRQHLEPGGRYRIEGTYTLASAPSADLCWFTTSRGPSGPTPIYPDEHTVISSGSGNFSLIKTLSDDGWSHLSFYVDQSSHGGVYFGEQGVPQTVLRGKGWSDFASHARPSRVTPNTRAIISEPGNAAIMSYLGQPVAPPDNLDTKYTPTNLLAAFTAISQKAGWPIKRLAIDDSEFPFLLYGVLSGSHILVEKDLRTISGYEYGGSVRGSTSDGSTYFSLNLIPRSQYAPDQATACNRRLMIRLQMLADTAQQEQ